jgi:hypothetical protein
LNQWADESMSEFAKSLNHKSPNRPMATRPDH